MCDTYMLAVPGERPGEDDESVVDSALFTSLHVAATYLYTFHRLFLRLLCTEI